MQGIMDLRSQAHLGSGVSLRSAKEATHINDWDATKTLHKLFQLKKKRKLEEKQTTRTDTRG